MRYLVTTDPSIAPSAIESWAMGVAAIEYIAALPSCAEPVKVYARAETDAEWRVLSFCRVGGKWSGTWVGCVPTTASDPVPAREPEAESEGPSEVESLRAELREVREVRDRMRDYHNAETMRLRTEILAIGERVRAACVAACRRVESENGDPYDAMSTGRSEGADECAEAIGALDLDALPENAPSR